MTKEEFSGAQDPCPALDSEEATGLRLVMSVCGQLYRHAAVGTEPAGYQGTACKGFSSMQEARIRNTCDPETERQDSLEGDLGLPLQLS